METVALLKCTDYEVENIERKLREGFELLGGESFLRELIPANSRVLLKPNFLSAVEKGSPVITHCAVFEAVIRIIKDYSSSISFGDSPGTDSPAKAAERSGFMEVAGRYGVKSADFAIYGIVARSAQGTSCVPPIVVEAASLSPHFFHPRNKE